VIFEKQNAEKTGSTFPFHAKYIPVLPQKVEWNRDFFAVMGVVCRWGTYVIPTVGIIAVALNLFGRDRGHFVTCNWLFQIGSETKTAEIDGSIICR
jgi:hypothetical protein